MRKAIIVALLLCGCTAVASETNDTSVTLSGLLHLGKPMEHLAPYYLNVTVAGGGTQRFWLTGETLKQFVEPIKHSGGGCVPIRVTGQFKTQYTGNTPSPQPTSPGWMIWLHVESATAELLIKKPHVIKEGANKSLQRTR